MIRRIARSPFARDVAAHIRTACWAVLITIIAFAHVDLGVDLGLALDGVR